MTGPSMIALKPLRTEHSQGLDAMLGARPEIEAFAKRVAAIGLRNVFLVGSGGGWLAQAPLKFLLDQRARAFSTFTFSANEFIYTGPASLGAESLVLLTSSTGTTPEVVEAARFARKHGATVAAFTKKPDSPLAQESDVVWAYLEDDWPSDPKHMALALLGNALLRETGDMSGDEYATHTRTLEALPDALLSAVRGAEALNRRIASTLKDEPIIYVLGGGPNAATAYSLAMCYLQEMQAKHAASFDSAEFFHGAMEMVAEDTPVILFLGEESTRPIDERAKRFLEKYTRKAFYIDARDLDLPGVDVAERGYASPYALAAVMHRLPSHFETATGRDLRLRRYMFKVDY